MTLLVGSSQNLILNLRNIVFIVIEEVDFPSDTCLSLSLASSPDYLNLLRLTAPSIFPSCGKKTPDAQTLLS